MPQQAPADHGREGGEALLAIEQELGFGVGIGLLTKRKILLRSRFIGFPDQDGSRGMTPYIANPADHARGWIARRSGAAFQAAAVRLARSCWRVLQQWLLLLPSLIRKEKMRWFGFVAQASRAN